MTALVQSLVVYLHNNVSTYIMPFTFAFICSAFWLPDFMKTKRTVSFLSKNPFILSLSLKCDICMCGSSKVFKSTDTLQQYQIKACSQSLIRIQQSFIYTNVHVYLLFQGTIDSLKKKKEIWRKLSSVIHCTCCGCQVCIRNSRGITSIYARKNHLGCYIYGTISGARNY